MENLNSLNAEFFFRNAYLQDIYRKEHHMEEDFQDTSFDVDEK